MKVKHSKSTSVLLINPPQSDDELFGKYKNLAGYFIPVGLLSIAAVLKANGYTVKILDSVIEGMTFDNFREFIRSTDYDIVGITSFTNTFQNTIDAARIVREELSDALIVIGGVHVTALPVRSLNDCPDANIIVIGEGEYTLLDICEHVERHNRDFSDIQGIVYRNQSEPKTTPPRPIIKHLDELPIPAYEDIPLEKYIPDDSISKYTPCYSLFASRGCPYNCIFCSAHITMGKQPRYKSLDYFFNEIDLLIEKYNAKAFIIQDSTLLNNKKWVKTLCERLIANNYKIHWTCNARVDQVDEHILVLMKKAGCWLIEYGAESANPKSLTLLRKAFTVEQIRVAIEQTRNAGIMVACTYIIGCPGEDLNDAWHTVRFAREMATEFAMFFLPVPYPGTILYDVCQKDGGLQTNISWKDYSAVNYNNPIYVNPRIDPETFKTLPDRAVFEYYKSIKVLWYNLVKISTSNDIKRYWKAAKLLILNSNVK
ncbi:B12-binding domain-containing radical SAM protein [candidate division KSB1 bacterium]|nr:B12-binding domain-containing radical SAM protein [candidate division KSB1 bacterium]